MKALRKDLLAVFQAALDAVSGQRVVARELATNSYPNSFHVVAIGKAADAMVQGIPSEKIESGLLISKLGHISHKLQQDSRISCLESDHPVPKEASIKAGRALLKYLKKLPDEEPCVFLISGGASALVEVLEEGWSLSQLQELTDYLLANAYPINEINTVRRRLSKIKGGGLWTFLGKRPVYCLMISDVPDDDPAVIGSGLLFPVKETELPDLPKKWVNRVNTYSERIQGEDFIWKIIASLEMAKKAAAFKAVELGYQVKVVPDFLEAESVKMAVDCVNTLKEKTNTLCIWGGETTVFLPKNTGMGGRNQHLALAAAIQMKDQGNMCLLAAGTDGSDGLTSATGAVVDSQTISRGEEQNLNAAEFLTNADSNSYFKEVGGLIETGATGTNVMDLVLGIRSIC